MEDVVPRTTTYYLYPISAKKARASPAAASIASFFELLATALAFISPFTEKPQLHAVSGGANSSCSVKHWITSVFV